MPLRTKISTKRFGTDSDGNGVVLYPVTDTIAVKSVSEKDSEDKPKTLEAIIQELRQASGRITVDSALSLTSVNPLQNKVVSEHLIFT